MTSTVTTLPKTVVIGSDHAGYAMKQEIIQFLQTSLPEISIEDCDYPKFGRQVAEKVSKEFDVAIPNVIGIVICGSGIGISISSNKSNGIRCALCHDHYTAKMSRLHNNANILGLGGKVIGIDVAKDIVDVFLRTSFSLDQRHIQRLKLMHEMEKF